MKLRDIIWNSGFGCLIRGYDRIQWKVRRWKLNRLNKKIDKIIGVKCYGEYKDKR